MVEKLALTTIPHPKPYKLQWIKEDEEIVVKTQVNIPISIGNYEETILCNVVPMDAGHVLLGSSWIPRCRDIVKDRYNEPVDDEHHIVNQITTLKKTRVKDISVLYFLYNVVDESGFEKIANAKSTKEAWEILKVAYKGDTRMKQVRVQAIRREFEHMEMDENEGVAEFIARVQKMANQLGMNGERFLLTGLRKRS
ncbi:uncharacterized protein LOC108319695 [Vigna angularis]|uniref:uncharacterized protein LOC108319695 n=1 Tax=Phaseolus angularis TaxID=3914 RepID=UPI000809F9DC|nr:uncharacterized protein LOC108319695 [Vigna angularis]